MITKEELIRIVKLTQEVPEEYRQKCFEILLQNKLEIALPSKETEKIIVGPPEHKKRKETPDFKVPIDVKAFLSQYGIDESLLWKVFLIDGTEFRSIYKLSTTKKARAQIEHALLLSLEAAMLTGKFHFEMKDLRKKCKVERVYDGPNFRTILNKNTALFNNITEDKPIGLSPAGKAELADILESFIG